MAMTYFAVQNNCSLKRHPAHKVALAICREKGYKGHMQKWEYLFHQTETPKEVGTLLNTAGADGWELIGVSSLTSQKMTAGPASIAVATVYWSFFFKRPAE